MVRVTGMKSLMMTPLSNEEGKKKVQDILCKKKGTETNVQASSEKQQCFEIKDQVKELTSLVDTLLEEGDASLFALAEKNNSTKDVKTYVKEFVSQYNNLLDALEKTNTSAAKGQIQELKGITSESSENLEKIGISYTKQGKLTMDEEKFNAASMEELKQVFHEKQGFTDKVGQKALYVGASAVTNAYLPTYGTTGTYTEKGMDQMQMVSKLVGSYLDSLQ